MNAVLIQQAVDADWELLRLTRAHHRWYAWQHGIEYLCLQANPVAPKRPTWGKLPLVALAMEMGFERVIWLDADAVIFDARVNLAQLVDTGIGMVRHPVPTHWSTGVMVAATSQSTFDFFQAAHSVPENDHPLAERLAVNSVLAQAEFFGLITQLAPAYNSLPGTLVAGSPVVMAAHGLPQETRREYIERWLKEAPVTEQTGPAALRAEVHVREDFGEFLNRRGLVGEAAEIGVQRGYFSRTLLDRWRGARLHLVDAWRHFELEYQDISNVSDAEHEECFQATKRILEPHVGRYSIHRKLSQEAISSFADASLDFVYIDANHDFQPALDDMRGWFPKVRPGGVLAGHDYVDGTFPAGKFGVKSAVRAFECETGLVAHGTLDPVWPSWYMVKQP